MSKHVNQHLYSFLELESAHRWCLMYRIGRIEYRYRVTPHRIASVQRERLVRQYNLITHKTSLKILFINLFVYPASLVCRRWRKEVDNEHQGEEHSFHSLTPLVDKFFVSPPPDISILHFPRFKLNTQCCIMFPNPSPPPRHNLWWSFTNCLFFSM